MSRESNARGQSGHLRGRVAEGKAGLELDLVATELPVHVVAGGNRLHGEPRIRLRLSAPGGALSAARRGRGHLRGMHGGVAAACPARSHQRSRRGVPRRRLHRADIRGRDLTCSPDRRRPSAWRTIWSAPRPTWSRSSTRRSPSTRSTPRAAASASSSGRKGRRERRRMRAAPPPRAGPAGTARGRARAATQSEQIRGEIAKSRPWNPKPTLDPEASPAIPPATARAGAAARRDSASCPAGRQVRRARPRVLSTTPPASSMDSPHQRLAWRKGVTT